MLKVDFGMQNDDPAIQFLINSTELSIRYFTLIDLIEESISRDDRLLSVHAGDRCA